MDPRRLRSKDTRATGEPGHAPAKQGARQLISIMGMRKEFLVLFSDAVEPVWISESDFLDQFNQNNGLTPFPSIHLTYTPQMHPNGSGQGTTGSYSFTLQWQVLLSWLIDWLIVYLAFSLWLIDWLIWWIKWFLRSLFAGCVFFAFPAIPIPVKNFLCLFQTLRQGKKLSPWILGRKSWNVPNRILPQPLLSVACDPSPYSAFRTVTLP